MVPGKHGSSQASECERFYPVLEFRLGSLCPDPPLQAAADVSRAPGLSLVLHLDNNETLLCNPGFYGVFTFSDQSVLNPPQRLVLPG